MSIEFTLTRQIDHPPERVFHALTDLDSAGKWMPGFVGIDKLTGGEFGVGTEWRETRKLFGRAATEQFEVTRCDPPTHFSVRVDGTKGDSKRGEYLFYYRLEPKDGGTEVTLDGAIQGLSGLIALVGKIMVGPYKKACAKDLIAMAEYLDG
jgi:uncharacterized protein YndB with AHSA1/START domain